MWILASAQSTRWPFIQIFSVGVMGISDSLSAQLGRPGPISDGAPDLGRAPLGGFLAGRPNLGSGVALAEEVEHEGGRQDGGGGGGLLHPRAFRGRAVHRLRTRA